MKIKRVKMIIMALGMCVLAACGTKQEADQGAESVTLTGVTRGTAAEVDDGDHTADDGDVPAAENEEPVYTDIACAQKKKIQKKIKKKREIPPNKNPKANKKKIKKEKIQTKKKRI